MQQCPKCGNELKLVPAGVGKVSGKPFNAFFACTDPTRTCKFTAPVNATPAAAQSMNYVQTKTNEQKELEKAMGMVRHGVSMKAIEAGMELNPITDKWISRWTDYIMTGKLLSTPIENKSNDEEIRLENIPF